jgi:CheY-like chemotaxis protein
MLQMPGTAKCVHLTTTALNSTGSYYVGPASREPSNTATAGSAMPIMPDVTNRTILIVEHDERMIALYARMLRIKGYAVRTALSAKAGLDDIELRLPDALIVDFRMPDMDGLEFLRRLRADDRHCHIPIGVVTDYFLDDRIPTALRELDADIRFKPLWPDDLADLARHLLSPTRSS